MAAAVVGLAMGPCLQSKCSSVTGVPLLMSLLLRNTSHFTLQNIGQCAGDAAANAAQLSVEWLLVHKGALAACGSAGTGGLGVPEGLRRVLGE